MNDVIGHLSYDINEENEFAVKPYSKKMARIIDEVSLSFRAAYNL